MMLGTFHVGDHPTVTYAISDAAGGNGVSGAVEFRVRRPGGAVDVYTDDDTEVTDDGPNVWRLALPALDLPGVWWVTAESTAGLLDTQQGSFRVDRTA